MKKLKDIVIVSLLCISNASAQEVDIVVKKRLIKCISKGFYYNITGILNKYPSLLTDKINNGKNVSDYIKEQINSLKAVDEQDHIEDIKEFNELLRDIDSKILTNIRLTNN